MTIDQAFQIADAQHRAGRLAEAEVIYRQIVAIDPQHVHALHALGALVLATGRYDEALDLISKAIALVPANAIYHSNLGETYRRMGRLDEAIASYRHALELRPDLADTRAFLAAALTSAGRLEEAVTSCRQAIETQPSLAKAHWNLAIALLQLGQFEEGWREYEWRWLTPSFPSPRRNFSAPLWSGSHIPGATLLVHAEQGLGDTLQFLRYFPLIAPLAQSSRIIFECQPELVSLAVTSRVHADSIVRKSGNDAALPPFHAHVPLLSLPLLLAHPEPLRMAAPYLHADDTRRAEWRPRLRDGFRVGVVWAGQRAHDNDRRRSIPFEQLSPLLRVEGVHFYSLQIGSEAKSDALIDLTAHLADFADTAALMAELDLIITVDTAAAHLAGALGRPVWTLLPWVSDWRWGRGGEDTPWYPTMRLFRQRAPGDWSEVVQRVAAELSAPQP